jgi:hypothetical protein
VPTRNPALNVMLACLFVSAMFVIPGACKRAASAEHGHEEKPGQRLGISVSKQANSVSRDSTVQTVLPKKSELKCPACGKRKAAGDELCDMCNNEVSNSCYRCGAFELNLNGKLCSSCSRYICALCNKRKQSRDDDLCTRCHNAIELKSRK